MRSMIRALFLAVAAGSLGACTMSLSSADAPTAETPKPVMAAAPAPQSVADRVSTLDPLPASRRESEAAHVVPAAVTLSPTLASSKGVSGVAERYTSLTSAMSEVTRKPIRSSSDVTRALKRITGWSPEELSASFIAYHAMLAAQAPGFRDAVKDGADAIGTEAFLAAITAHPESLRRLPGAKDGLASLHDGMAQSVGAIKAVGTQFREAWTEMQRRADAGSTTSGACASGLGVLPFGTGASEAALTVDRILVLGARIVLGKADGANAASTVSLMENNAIRQCFKFAKLNLNQCMAARHGAAEAAYCAGRHGADEVAACVEWLLPASAS